MLKSFLCKGWSFPVWCKDHKGMVKTDINVHELVFSIQ